jgi:hypothetical protein
MARLEEKVAGKAPKINNAGNIDATPYQRAQTAKGRATQKPGMTHL